MPHFDLCWINYTNAFSPGWKCVLQSSLYTFWVIKPWFFHSSATQLFSVPPFLWIFLLLWHGKTFLSSLWCLFLHIWFASAVWLAHLKMLLFLCMFQISVLGNSLASKNFLKCSHRTRVQSSFSRCCLSPQCCRLFTLDCGNSVLELFSFIPQTRTTALHPNNFISISSDHVIDHKSR